MIQSLLCVTSDPVELVPGVLYLIPVPAGANTLLVSFDGGSSVVLVEAPSSYVHGNSLVSTMDDLMPDSELRYVVQSHYHVDHAGAAREIVALTNATLVCGHDVAEFYYKHVFGAKSTVVPDTWSTMGFQANDATIGDFSVDAYPYPVEHAEDMVITEIKYLDTVYVYVADIYNAGGGLTITLGGPPMFFDFLRANGYISEETCESLVGELIFVGAHVTYFTLEQALDELGGLDVDVGC